MMSLVSAYGPSVTVLFFPPTTLPERSRGCPMLFSFPFFSSSLNQAIHFCIDCCASCGLSVLMSVVPRYRKTYSLISDLLENVVRSPYERSRMADPDIFFKRGRALFRGLACRRGGHRVHGAGEAPRIRRRSDRAQPGPWRRSTRRRRPSFPLEGEPGRRPYRKARRSSDAGSA